MEVAHAINGWVIRGGKKAAQLLAGEPRAQNGSLRMLSCFDEQPLPLLYRYIQPYACAYPRPDSRREHPTQRHENRAMPSLIIMLTPFNGTLNSIYTSHLPQHTEHTKPLFRQVSADIAHTVSADIAHTVQLADITHSLSGAQTTFRTKNMNNIHSSTEVTHQRGRR